MLKTGKRMTHIRYIDGNSLYESQMLFDLPTENNRFNIKCLLKKLRNSVIKTN